MLEIIKRTGAFLIMAETLYQFVQENRYARYVRLLIRLMTLAILILPVLDLFQEGSSLRFYEKLDAMGTEYAVYAKETYQAGDARGTLEECLSAYNSDQEIVTYASSDIKSACNKCVLENGYQITDVLITEDGIAFRMRPLCEEITVTQIERVTIETGEVGGVQETEKETKDSYAQAEADMKQVLAEYLGIAESLIEVEIYD